MTKAVVILGAGASFDIQNASVNVSDKDARPPLARELFQRRWWNQRDPYPGAEVLGAQLAPLAARAGSEFDVEAKLSEYANSSNPTVARQFRDLPPYCRDVLVRATYNYVPSPAAYIDLVARLLGDQSHEVMFVVLNYDTLLERTLTKYDPAFIFNALQHYVARERQARVIKIHGSINWFVRMPGTAADEPAPLSWTAALDVFNPATADRNNLVVDDRRDLSLGMRLPAGGPMLYPWLTAPVKGKDLRCPDDHREHFQAFVRECRKFLIIGTSGWDDDVLTELAQATSTEEGYLLHYVDVGPNTKKIRARFEQGVRAFIPSGPRSPTPRVSESGLSGFLSTEDPERFLASG